MRTVTVVVAALSLGGCGFINAVTPLPDEQVAACLSQGAYLDRQTRQCATMSPPTPPSNMPAEGPESMFTGGPYITTPEEQQAAIAKSQERLKAKTKNCANSTNRQVCVSYFEQQEIQYKIMCQGAAGVAARILIDKNVGWPAEMTAENELQSRGPSVPVDVLGGIIRITYSRDWPNAYNLSKEVLLRCLNGNPF